MHPLATPVCSETVSFHRARDHQLRTPYGGMRQSDASPSTSLITPTTRICVTSTRRLESATESALAGNSDKVPLLYNAQMNVRSSAFSALTLVSWATGRPAKKLQGVGFVGDDDLTGALHVL